MVDEVLLGVSGPAESDERRFVRSSSMDGLPPCEVCGFSAWPEGGMHAARSIHMRQHERGEASSG
jgi:hypothetical protein